METKAICRPFEKGDKRQVEALLRQLSASAQPLVVEKMLENSHCNCLVMEIEAQVIAFGCLLVNYVPTAGEIGRIEGVVVAEEYRGQGLGQLLVENLLKHAKNKKIKRIDLTSNATRLAARRLYGKLGFEKVDTDVFRLELE